MKNLTILLAVALTLIVTQAAAQKQNIPHEQIFKIQQSNTPANIVKWVDNNSFIISKREDNKTQFYLMNVKKKQPILLTDEEFKTYTATKPLNLKIENGQIEYNGEILTTKGNNANPELSPDGNYIAFTRDNDLYTIRLSDKKEFRLTFDGSDVILNGYSSWAYMEEILGRSTNHKAYWWSPDSKTIAFFRSDDTEVPLFTITDSPGLHGYVETMRYPKCGDKNAEVKTGFIDPEGSKPVVWADFNSKNDQYFGMPYWTSNGNIWVQWINRGQDDYKIYNVNIQTGQKTEVYNEKQKTWISIDEDRIRFLSDGKAVILSDKSGYFHMYLHANDGKLINPVTKGDYTVLDITRIDEKNKTIYFTCYKDNIGCTDFYKVSFNGENLQRLSFGNYTHRVSLSPDAKYFTTSFSNVSTPNKLALYNNAGKLIYEIDDSYNSKNAVYNWAQAELFTVKSDDGKYDLPVKIVKPVNMEQGKKYPVLINVYGGPAAVTVRDGWGISQLANWYAHEGLIQVWLDHRGSLHFGKNGQNEMHRQLGTVETKDYSTCVKWLVENAQADPERICINGFSYGGYITSYVMLAAPDVFTHGIAGGSVTDWMLYDAPYTERYMDHPKENPEGYKQSSLLTHAGNLKGKLLLTHGTIDENVHIQNTFQFVSELQDKGKQFDLMVYPSSRHGYRGQKSLHFRNLQIKFIYDNLLQKPLPQVLKEEMKIE